METWKSHISISKYGNSRVKDKDRHPLIKIITVREVAFTIDIISILISVLCMYYFNVSFLVSLGAASMFHLLVVLILATVSTIMERSWRKRLDTKKAFYKTLNRFALNKERRVKDVYKAGF